MHRSSDSPQRKHRRRPRAGGPGTARTLRRKAKTARNGRRRHDANRSAGLLAHVFEVMELFPAAGDQAIAELVGKMQAARPAGAAAGKRRRAGSRRQRRGR